MNDLETRMAASLHQLLGCQMFTWGSAAEKDLAFVGALLKLSEAAAVAAAGVLPTLEEIPADQRLVLAALAWAKVCAALDAAGTTASVMSGRY